ncbi:MAG: transporter substrate-binding domain-containing protein [Clostridia bacterium]|nr:transporter substrate-binding domain-containing protein [Clostridia bacterium]
MKRILTLALALILVLGATFSFSSCGKGSDWEAVKEDGYFVCGITVYDPMNYFDEDGNLIGFDTEFAKAVAEKLGVEAKFQVIDWPQKYLELESGSIDLIWNGFTYGEEKDGVSRTEYVDFTHAYLENRQCLVTKADRVAELNSADALKGKKGVAEGASSGEALAITLTGDEKNITAFTSQAKALMELVAGNADFAVIDYQMAKAMVGTGDYASLSINEAVKPESEVYAIGCRKGSDLTAKINEAIEALSKDGTLKALAEKYNLTNDLIPNIGSES